MLEIYRRHNPKNCTSKDTQKCKAKRRPCPIWIRGTKPDGNYIRKPLKLRDWNRALDQMQLMEAGENPKPPIPMKDKSRVTIDEWRDRFVATAESENISEETLRKYKLLFRLLSEFATPKGIRHPNEFDLETLRQFRSTWKDGPASRMKKQERLRSIFNFALASKWIEKNEALGLGKIQVEIVQKRPFDDDEMEAILKVARDAISKAEKLNGQKAKEAARQVYTFILVMRYSGLRTSDVCTLTIDSLHEDHLVVRTIKTGEEVTVLLPPVVAVGLRSIEKASPRYFFWNGNSKLASVTDLWRMHRLKPIFDEAKIQNAHPHRFRHTFAAELLRQGTSVRIVADLLGNSEKIVEKHYSRWIKGRQQGLDEAVKKANGYHDLVPV
jgi:site-specific recombinase XerD